MLQVRGKLFDCFSAVDEDQSNALDASELSVLFQKLGLEVPDEVGSPTSVVAVQNPLNQ